MLNIICIKFSFPSDMFQLQHFYLSSVILFFNLIKIHSFVWFHCNKNSEIVWVLWKTTYYHPPFNFLLLHKSQFQSWNLKIQQITIETLNVVAIFSDFTQTFVSWRWQQWRFLVYDRTSNFFFEEYFHLISCLKEINCLQGFLFVGRFSCCCLHFNNTRKSKNFCI